MTAINDLIKNYTKEGRVPVSEVHQWYRRHRGIPIRNFQRYVSNGILPPPVYEGRNAYYSVDVLSEIIIPLMRMINGIKRSNRLELKHLRNLYNKNKTSNKEDMLKSFQYFMGLYKKRFDKLAAEHPIYSVSPSGDYEYSELNDLKWYEFFTKQYEGLK